MSNLNNIYGKSHSCPAIVNSGHGVNTIYKNNQVLNSELRGQLGIDDSLNFRLTLQKSGVDLINERFNKTSSEFMCDTAPHGYTYLPKKINLTTCGGDFHSQFKLLNQ